MVPERGFYYCARVHGRLRHCAARNFLAGDQAVLTVQVQGHAVFDPKMPQAGRAIVFDPLRLIQRFARLQVFFQRAAVQLVDGEQRSEEHTSELQSLMRISYAVFCLKKKTKTNYTKTNSCMCNTSDTNKRERIQ